MKKDIREYLNIKTLLLVLLVALVIFIPAWGNRRYMNIAILVGEELMESLSVLWSHIRVMN